DPSGQLERGPVMIGPAEGDEHGMVTVDRRNAFALDQHGDVARRLLQHSAHVTTGYAFADERPAPVHDDEIDVLLGREPDEVGARVRRGEGDRAAWNAVLDEHLPATVQ